MGAGARRKEKREATARWDISPRALACTRHANRLTTLARAD